MPGGPDDPASVSIKLETDRIELCLSGATPQSYRYTTIARDGERRWRLAGV